MILCPLCACARIFECSTAAAARLQLLLEALDELLQLRPMEPGRQARVLAL
jgi:hypothetical protein